MPTPLHKHQDKISQSSSIPTWLDAQPNLPNGYESIGITPRTAQSTSNAKRRRPVEDGVTETEHRKGYKRHMLDESIRAGGYTTRGKRRALRCVAANAMAGPGPSLKEKERLAEKQTLQELPRQLSLRRRAGKGNAETPRRTRASRVPSVYPDDELPDEDPTPKAPSWGAAPILQPPGSDHSSLASSRSRSRARSNSPIKRGDLQLSTIKVRLLEGQGIPDEGTRLWRDLRRIGQGYRVLPLDLKKKPIQEVQDDPIETDRYFDKAAHGRGAIFGDDGLNHEECWIRATEIHRAALDCRNKALAEPGWNSEVHSTLLNLALRGEWRSKGIWYRDVTTARIRDRSLLDVNQQLKMVDYALVIEPDSVTESNLQDVMMARGLSSLNHADSEYLRFVPIGVSMETKRVGIDEDRAEVQVSTWVKAHFAKLKQLAPNATHLPVLPLITAQGHDWKFMLAEMPVPDQVIVHRDVFLGATNTMLGIYQLLAAVKRLANWVDEEYRPWFMKEILGSTPISVRSDGTKRLASQYCIT